MENTENANSNPENQKSIASSFTMPFSYWQKLQKHSKDTGLKISDILRRALEVYFKSLGDVKHES